jgi:hypothetical protein
MPSRVTASVASSNTPLTCVIDNPGNGVKITEAAIDNPDESTSELNVADDCQSFQIPIDTAGIYIVGVTVNKIVGRAVNIAEDAEGGTLLLALYPGNVAKNGTFTLQVTP